MTHTAAFAYAVKDVDHGNRYNRPAGSWYYECPLDFMERAGALVWVEPANCAVV